MVEFEADDALAAAAAVAHADQRVKEVLVCTPDKDLAQCVTDDGRVVQWDRRKNVRVDRRGVIEKFGVPPASIPDYLALVGDAADGFPGLPGFGPRTAALLLARYGHLDGIPADAAHWDVPLRGAARLAATLSAGMEHARLFRRLATLRGDALPVFPIDALRWAGPRPGFDALCARLDAPRLAERAARRTPGVPAGS
jgi:5'-3' exonuclease